MAKSTVKVSQSAKVTASKLSKVNTTSKTKEAKAPKSEKLKLKTISFGKTGLTGRT